MKKNELASLALDLMKSAEVVQVFNDDLWVRVNRGSYNALYEHMHPEKFELKKEG